MSFLNVTRAPRLPPTLQITQRLATQSLTIADKAPSILLRLFS